MSNNCLSVLYKHIIQVENKNVGLKVGGTNIPLPPNKKRGAHVHLAPLPPPPASHASDIYIMTVAMTMKLTNKDSRDPLIYNKVFYNHLAVDLYNICIFA